MRFRIHDGACDALLPGAVGALAGHPGGLGSPYTCGCGHPDCPHPTPEPAPVPEGADGDAAEAPLEPPRIGHLWLDFAEDQLTEQKRAERGTLPVPEPERVVCPTCDSTGLLYFKVPTESEASVTVVARPDEVGAVMVGGGGGGGSGRPPCDAVAGELRCAYPEGHLGDHHQAEPDGPGWGWQRTELDIDSEGNPVPGPELSPAYTAPTEPVDDDTAEFEIAEPSAHDPSSPEVEPGHTEVVCGHCRGTGWAPPPPPPLIPNNPAPFRAGIRADLVELVLNRVDGVGGYGA